MPTTRLDHMGPRDRDRLAELLRAEPEFSAEESAVALAMFDEACSVDDASCDYEFLGAYDERDGRLLGYACCGPTPATEGTFDLYWLAVHPGAQRGGVGSALLERVEAMLFDRGGRLVLVETSSRDVYAAAREFYARHGYAESARVRDFYGPADDRIMLTTRLGSRTTR